MAAASRLCVVQVEEIGIHYFQTLRCWRKNVLKNKRQIRALGFDDKFIRTWVHFDHCVLLDSKCAHKEIIRLYFQGQAMLQHLVILTMILCLQLIRVPLFGILNCNFVISNKIVLHNSMKDLIKTYTALCELFSIT